MPTRSVDTERHAAITARVRYLVEAGVPVAEAIAQAQQPLDLSPEILDLLARAEQ